VLASGLRRGLCVALIKCSIGLAETLAGRMECVSHAIFFIIWLNAPAVCVLM